MKKLRLYLMAAVLCLSLSFTGCSGYSPIEPSDKDITVVGHVEDKEVYLDQLRFAAYTCREQLIAEYGEDIFKGDDAQKYLDMLRDMVYSSITADYATLLLCEESYFGLGETAVLERVDQKLNELVDALGGMSKYKRYLKENHLTDRLIRFSTEISLLQSELFYVYRDDISIIENDDEKLYDIIKKEFIKVRHVFVPHSDAQLMDTVTSELESGGNISDLITKYGKDPDMMSEGIFIIKGYMSERYEASAFDLEIGEMSGVVEDANGLYVIERLDVAPTDVMLKFDYLKQLYQTYTFYSMIDQKQTELEFVPNDAGTEFIKNPF